MNFQLHRQVVIGSNTSMVCSPILMVMALQRNTISGRRLLLQHHQLVLQLFDQLQPTMMVPHRFPVSKKCQTQKSSTPLVNVLSHFEQQQVRLVHTSCVHLHKVLQSQQVLGYHVALPRTPVVLLSM